jgi:hypothetical protein
MSGRTNWAYPLTSATMDRSRRQSSLVPPYFAKLSGIDGSLDGSVRPFPGFIAVHQFDHEKWGINHDTTSEITDLFPISFVVGSDGFGYGFVYRVRRKAQETFSDVFIDYYCSKTNVWIRSLKLIEGVRNAPKVSSYLGKPMSVASVGRIVYVYVQDYQPVAFYVESESPYDPVVRTNTGPGKTPSLIAPENAVTPGSITTIFPFDRPGAGQIFLTEYKPSELALGLGSGTGSEGSSGTLFGQADDGVALLDPGDYAFAYLLFDTRSGNWSSLSEIVSARKPDFVDNSPTAGGISKSLYAYLEVCYDNTKYDLAYVFRSVRTQAAGGTFTAGILILDKIIKLSDYATSNNPLGNPNMSQSIYCYELTDPELVSQESWVDEVKFDEQPPYGGACLWYNTTMVVSAIKTSPASSLDERRDGDSLRGLGELRWSSSTRVGPEVFSPKNRYYPPISTNDVICLRHLSPNAIGFSSDRAYMIRQEPGFFKVVPMHDGFGVVNERAAENVGSVVYFVSHRGLISTDANGQLDAVNSLNQTILEDWRNELESLSLGYDPSMGSLFLLNPIKKEMAIIWFGTSKLTWVEDVPMEQCARGSWPENFVFDAASLEAFEGFTNSTYLNSRVERCFFIRNSPKQAPNQGIPSFKFYVYMVDTKREKVSTTALRPGLRHSMFPFQGEAVLTYLSGDGTGLLGVSGPSGFTISDDMSGLSLYVLWSKNKDLIGNKVLILDRYNPTTLRVVGSFGGLTNGDLLGVSPVPVEIVGWPVASQLEDGSQFGPLFDYFNMKKVTQGALAFTEVSGSLLSLNTELSGIYDAALTYSFGMYVGDSTVLKDKNYPRNTNGEMIKALVIDEPIYYVGLGRRDEVAMGVSGYCVLPSFKIAIPDVDFKCVGGIVCGAFEGMMRTEYGKTKG